MERLRRRAVGFVGALLAVVTGLTLVYRWGMTAFEGRTPSFARSLRFVVETMTTVGYGSEATWSSPAMELVVTGMMLTGVAFFFLSLPLLVVPMVEQALSSDPPSSVAMEDHVVLCGYSGRGRAFVAELDAWDTDHVIVEPDRERAAELHDAGHSVVFGDYESTEDLQAACVDAARAVVADAGDETNASVALTCREVAPEVRVVGFAEDPEHADYLQYAGVDEVLTPRHLLGESLAEKVTSAVSTELGDVVEFEGDFDVAELPVQMDSDIAGVRLGDTGIRERTGADIIGAWRDGAFDPTPDPGDVLEPGVILLVAGRADQLRRLKKLTRTETRSHAHGRVIVVGNGEVGRTVTGSLAAAGVPYTVVDLEEGPAIDVVGDARDEQTLQEAGVDEARGVILALPDDTTTIFTTLVIRELEPTVEVTARASEPDSVRKLYLAGADYVLSLSAVSGRMLAGEVLDEEVVTPDKQVDIVRCRAPALVGRSLADADVRSRTGATVIAVERDGELLTDLDPGFVVRADDELVIAGSDEGINRFMALARP